MYTEKRKRREEIQKYFEETFGICRNDCLKGKVIRCFSNGAGSLVDIGVEIEAYIPTSLEEGTEVLLTISDTFISNKFGPSIHGKIDSIYAA